MKAVQTNYGTKPEWLGSEKYVCFTGTIDDNDTPIQRGEKKIVPSGRIILRNGAAIGLLFAEVDITGGAAPGALMREGYYLPERLPVAPSAAEIEELAAAGVKLRNL